MPGVIFSKSYQLNDFYGEIKLRANQILKKWMNFEDLFVFNDLDNSITFSTEKLIPITISNRPRVMLLFSNPHPYSVYQGMFLSPDISRHENPFWPAMKDSGWIHLFSDSNTPNQLAEIFLNGEYDGPFELVFYCYYSFPTNYPEDICRVFSKEYFNQAIVPEAEREFRQAITDTGVDVVVTFNKTIFNLVSDHKVDHYIDRLINGDVIQSQISAVDCHVPIFLTFPTGWHYHSEQKQLRRSSLKAIRDTICNR